MTERRLAVVNDYTGLVAAIPNRIDELQITHETVDSLSGIQAGYASKLLAPVPLRSFGRVSLGPILQTLGLRLVVEEDLTALKQIESRLTKRLRTTTRDAGSAMLAQKRNKRRGFSAFRASPEFAKLARFKQLVTQTPNQRSHIARIAAQARWRMAKQDADLARAGRTN